MTSLTYNRTLHFRRKRQLAAVFFLPKFSDKKARKDFLAGF
jgi:hypothetical protein